MEDESECIYTLRPVTFNWNEFSKTYNKNKNTSINNFGLIAQDVEEIIPELIHNMYVSDIKGIDYIQLIPILIQSVKELELELIELENME